MFCTLSVLFHCNQTPDLLAKNDSTGVIPTGQHQQPDKNFHLLCVSSASSFFICECLESAKQNGYVCKNASTQIGHLVRVEFKCVYALLKEIMLGLRPH